MSPSTKAVSSAALALIVAAAASCGESGSHVCAAAADHLSQCLGISAGAAPEQCDAAIAEQVLSASCSELSARGKGDEPWWCGPLTRWLPGCGSERKKAQKRPELPAAVNGFTHVSLPIQAADLRGIDKNGAEMWIVGDQGTAVFSHDGGRSWQVHSVECNRGTQVRQVYGGSLRAVTVLEDRVVIAGEGLLSWISPSRVSTYESESFDFSSMWLSEDREGYLSWGIAASAGDEPGNHAVLWAVSPLKSGFASRASVDALVGPIHGVWGASASDIWAVGPNGKLLNVAAEGDADIARLRFGVGKVDDDLNAVSGSNSGSVWVVGDAGTVLHGRSGNWTPMRFPVYDAEYREFYPDLHAVWVDESGDHAWIVGQPAYGKSTLLHVEHAADGTFRKTQVNVPSAQPLHGIAGSSACDLWIVGGDATLLHRTCD